LPRVYAESDGTILLLLGEKVGLRAGV